MVVLRPAVATDVVALHDVAAVAYQLYVPRLGRRPAPMESDYAQLVRDTHVWVAVDGEVVVGLVVFIPHADHVLLENVAVVPSAQGRGIGARLMAIAEDYARDHGTGEVRLYTNEVMVENLAYYQRHGYRETHRAAQDGFRRVFLRKLAGDRGFDISDDRFGRF